MEKCWFVLRQNQYPPPTLPVNGIGSGNGPISLGHIIPNTIDLDGVINRTVKGFNFTPLVPVVSTHAWDLEWEMGGDRQVGFSADPRAPVAQAVGLTVQANAVLAFQQTVQRYRTFHSLNCYIIQPTRDFVAESLEEPQVADYIQRTKFLGSWTVYMTTGVTIARGSSGGTSELRQRSIGAGATFF
ncbi:hypothetical protein M7I_4866 [Glarea lozoyensis 74030]|uniref:Uncharacterized protein n=1 Tax=Glarea lozoyensis (strain ATCC 74030 / MF5533) TaxID=1104152 RepID=H0EQB8_GLAL7|nr:hypothetical protein M7I_4866 [Glarea lozoyensis 74030]